MELVVFMLQVKRSDRGLASLFSSFWSTATLRLKDRNCRVSRASRPPQGPPERSHHSTLPTQVRAALEAPAVAKPRSPSCCTHTHSQGKAVAAGAGTKEWHEVGHNWHSLDSGAWGQWPSGGRITCSTYNLILRQVLLKTLLSGHVGSWNTSSVLEVSGTLK